MSARGSTDRRQRPLGLLKTADVARSSVTGARNGTPGGAAAVGDSRSAPVTDGGSEVRDEATPGQRQSEVASQRSEMRRLQVSASHRPPVRG